MTFDPTFTDPPRTALVLGLTGSYGHTMAAELLRRGWAVRALVRDRERGVTAAADLPGTIELVEGDVLDSAAVSAALEGAAVVVHGVNAPYPKWDPLVVRYAESVADAAAAARATILFPGNVYAFGPGERLDEATPEAPPTRKGELRAEVERILRAATARGARLVLLRGGDFFGSGSASSWMTHFVDKACRGGAILWPGALESRHQWAFLPDFAHAHVDLLEHGGELPAVAVFHFEGHVVTGREVVASLRALLGDLSRRVRPFPWLLVRVAGLMVPMMRELATMRYQWDSEILMSGEALRRQLGAVRHTPLSQALRAELATHGAAV